MATATATLPHHVCAWGIFTTKGDERKFSRFVLNEREAERFIKNFNWLNDGTGNKAEVVPVTLAVEGGEL